MLRAIIFDCDGVIADTEPLHFGAFQRVLDEEGILLTREQYYRDYLALDDRNCFSQVHRDRQVALDQEKLSDLITRKAEYIEPMMRSHLLVFPGVVQFMRQAFERYPLAVASGALRHEVEMVLQHAGVTELFQVIVAAEDVANGKPHPEPFLKACALLNASREEAIVAHECLVIEDSIPGIRAAHNAGMRCLAVTNSYPRERLDNADLVVEGLDEVSMDDLEDLFRGK
jgi:beta-phosphoglucomutase